MREDIQKELKKLKKTVLTTNEKDSSRTVLRSFMDQHPVTSTARVRHQTAKSKPFMIRKRLMLPAAIIAALLLGGSVSYAAENTVPGDALYPIKISVNEEVRAALALSDQARADWEVTRAGRRLEEAERLATRNQLNTALREQIEQNFDKHAQRVAAKVQEIENSGDIRSAADLASNFESSLRAHEAILAYLASNDGNDVSAIASKVRTEATSLAHLREETETRFVGGDLAIAAAPEAAAPVAMMMVQTHTDTSAEKAAGTAKSAPQTPANPEVKQAAEGKVVAAQNKVKEVSALMDRLGGRIDSNIRDQAQTRLDTAHKLLDQARTNFEAGAYAEAFLGFQNTIRAAQEAQIMLHTQTTLQAEVHETERHYDEDDSDTEEGMGSDNESDDIKSSGGNDDDADEDTDSPHTGSQDNGVEIQNHFGNKIIYTTDMSADADRLRTDCEARGGTFNTCGSPCPEGALCVQVCAYTCENVSESNTETRTRTDSNSEVHGEAETRTDSRL